MVCPLKLTNSITFIEFFQWRWKKNRRTMTTLADCLANGRILLFLSVSISVRSLCRTIYAWLYQQFIKLSFSFWFSIFWIRWNEYSEKYVCLCFWVCGFVLCVCIGNVCVLIHTWTNFQLLPKNYFHFDCFSNNSIVLLTLLCTVQMISLTC